MAPRGRARKVGNTRMDAALDAMRQLGFKEQLVRKTVEELLDVYEGTQGWPFIEEASYKLLIETILSKQQNSEEEKKKEDSLQLQDNARRDDVAEPSAAGGITKVGSSNLVAQDSVLHANDGLHSAYQTNDHDSAPRGNLETDIEDTTVPTDRGGHGPGIRVESKNEKKPVDNVKGSNSNAFVSNVGGTSVMTSMIESPKTLGGLPYRRRTPCYGWIGSDDNVKLKHFPIPPLSKQIEKLIGQIEDPQSDSRRRRKSRWDEKPDDM